MSVLIVTGTGTGVGKTVVTAALAALALDRGGSLAVVKPAQTGVGPDEAGDLADIGRLSGAPPAVMFEFARYPDPLSPAAAARLSGLAPLDLADVAERIRALADEHRLVLIEGAGGLLVRYDDEGATLADLAAHLHAPVLVVAEAGLGTLNATALTLEALAGRGLDLAGVVIGAWPKQPDLGACSNIRDLETLGARPLAGALPAGCGGLDATTFREVARSSVGPAMGGRFDAAAFRARHDPAEQRRSAGAGGGVRQTSSPDS